MVYVYDAATSAWRWGATSLSNTGAQSFPLLAGMLIGSPQNYSDTTYRSQIAKLDMAILGMYKGWNSSGHATSVNAIKALNSGILLGNYTIMTEVPNPSSDAATADLRTKLGSEVGPGGVGDWWAYDSAGAHTDWSGGTYGANDTNVTLLTTVDSSGDRWPQWMAKRDNTYVVGVANFDIWFSDNNFYRPRVDADWDRSGSNDSADNATVRTNWRNGQRAYYDTAKTLQPTKRLMVNADNDLDGSVFPGGTSYAQYTGVLHGAYLEHAFGKSWSAEEWGGWTTVMGWYHRVFTNLLDPKMVILDIYMGDGLTNYQALRYSFGACLMNNGYFSASDDYHDVLWYDEFDLAGTSTTKWLGTAIDPPQTTAWSLGVYRRRFTGGMVLVNPKGNSSRTVTVGSGYHRFSGSQAPSVNSGASVTSTVTLADRDGLFLVKD